jgi:hypothetical protein
MFHSVVVGYMVFGPMGRKHVMAGSRWQKKLLTSGYLRSKKREEAPGPISLQRHVPRELISSW